MEQPGVEVPELGPARPAYRPTMQNVTDSRPQLHEATWTHQVKLLSLGDLHPGGHLVSQATPTSPQDAPVPTATSSTVLPAIKRLEIRVPSLPEPAHAPGSTAIQASPSSTTSLSSDSATSVIMPPIAPAIKPSITRSFVPSILPDIPVPSESSLQIINPSEIAAEHMTKIYRNDVTSQTHMQQVMIGAMAPGPSSEPAPNMPAAPIAVPTNSVGLVPTAIAPPSLVDDGFANPAVSQSASASFEPQQARSEPRQGMLVLDGALLGRWMIDHLESSASRPGAMTTGIDPRMNATYPGSPTGA